MVVPIFKLNSKEQWRPQPVETAERFGTIDGQPVQLSNLPAAGGRIDFPPTMRDPSNTPVVGYHRVVEAANLWWHQYWLWYLYNPWEILGVGRHEGDWEFVQLGCIDEQGKRPVLDDGLSTQDRREARVLALRARRRTTSYLRRSRIARQFLYARRTRRGRCQRSGQEVRRHRLARVRQLGEMARDVGKLHRPWTVPRFAWHAA